MDPTKRPKLGDLNEFKNVIVFFHDNGKGQSGAWFEGDHDELRAHMVRVLKQKPELRRLFSQAVDEASAIILVR